MPDIPTNAVGNADKAKKPTRAEARAARQAANLQAQAAAHAEYAAAPPTLRQLTQATAENHAAPVAVAAASSVRNREEDREEGRQPGRPSEYSEERDADLCGWLASGGTLRAWCRTHGISPATVYRWMAQNAPFQARYTRAHEDRADTLADEIVEIADAAARMPTIEGVAAAKLQVEARKWIAAKSKPGRWGDKQTVEHHGAVSIRIGIPGKVAPDKVQDVTEITPKAPALR